MDSTLVVPISKRQRIDSEPSLSSPEDRASGNMWLVECQAMDTALALVACAGINDVNAYLLDGILFHTDFCSLLDVRRKGLMGKLQGYRVYLISSLSYDNFLTGRCPARPFSCDHSKRQNTLFHVGIVL
ncbi:hypothetical protein RvY_18758-2 [Ramazzottius varieornatus]|uniref:Uncharacterized protein n=1 Tax=Ramazzottius varieornatus TaxID=947166 RepID=A0A1D1W9W7_RAMVA|nr:hypothetical protein RvY_18758-2 [Ramazzottius varieornatus]